MNYSVVDHTPPTVALHSPTDGATYTLNSDVRADFSCSDGIGVVVLCRGDSALGAPIDTTALGQKTFTVTAMDKARNTTSTSASYRVVYAFDGFYAPVSASLTSVKAGDTVPVKFSLGGDQGLDVFAAGSPAWRPAPCTGPSTVTDSSTAAGRLTYQPQSARYTFAWSTDATWVGSCKDLVVTLRDGTVHTARFKFAR